jgi:DNA-binding NarL/FixJ family response regulator
MISLILVDDHQIVRQGLRALLDREADIRVVCEGETGLEAISLVRNHKPDVIVIDLFMPGLNGLEVTRHVCNTFPETKVVILSMHSSTPYVIEALRNGASAYVLKTSGAEDLLHAIRVVARGGRYISHQLPHESIRKYIENARETVISPLDMLTNREREVFSLAAQGMSTSEIASCLKISTTTAMTHRSNLMCKLGLHNQTELVRFAIKSGVLLDLEE